MLPAQPPKSRRRPGTRKDTLRMCSWSGRIWSANRPSKVMMVSNAREPQITAAMDEPLVGVGGKERRRRAALRDRSASRRKPATGGSAAASAPPRRSGSEAERSAWAGSTAGAPKSAGMSTRRTTARSWVSSSDSSTAGIASGRVGAIAHREAQLVAVAALLAREGGAVDLDVVDLPQGRRARSRSAGTSAASSRPQRGLARRDQVALLVQHLRHQQRCAAARQARPASDAPQAPAPAEGHPRSPSEGRQRLGPAPSRMPIGMPASRLGFARRPAPPARARPRSGTGLRRGLRAGDLGGLDARAAQRLLHAGRFHGGVLQRRCVRFRPRRRRPPACASGAARPAARQVDVRERRSGSGGTQMRTASTMAAASRPWFAEQQRAPGEGRRSRTLGASASGAGASGASGAGPDACSSSKKSRLGVDEGVRSFRARLGRSRLGHAVAAERRRRRRPLRRGGRRHRGGHRGVSCRSMRGVEHLAAAPAAHPPIGDAKLVPHHLEGGAAGGAAGDQAHDRRRL